MSLRMNVLASIEGEFDRVAGLASVQARFPNAKRMIEFRDGVGGGAASKVAALRRVIAGGGNDDLDLAGGALVDVFGNAVSFAKVKMIAVMAAAGNANPVVVGAGGAQAFVGPFGAAAHTVSVAPGGVFMAVAPTADGWPAAEGASDILRLANGVGAASTADIYLIGD